MNPLVKMVLLVTDDNSSPLEFKVRYKYYIGAKVQYSAYGMF